MGKLTRRSVFLDEEFWVKMSGIAKREGGKTSDIVRRAVYKFLKDRGEAQ